MLIQQSTGRPGSALNHAIIESWHSTLAFELRSLEHFNSKVQARAGSGPGEHSSLASPTADAADMSAADAAQSVGQRTPPLSEALGSTSAPRPSERHRPPPSDAIEMAHRCPAESAGRHLRVRQFRLSIFYAPGTDCAVGEVDTSCTRFRFDHWHSRLRLRICRSVGATYLV
jgi:hypothetical protein